MNQRVLFVGFLTIVWVGLSNSIALSNIVFGAGLGIGILFFLGESAVPKRQITFRVFHSIRLIGTLIVEIALSTIRVARLVITRSSGLNSGFIEFDVSLKRDDQVAILAQMITLTPGTLSVIALQNPSRLCIHALEVDYPEKLRTDIQSGFEAKIASALPTQELRV